MRQLPSHDERDPVRGVRRRLWKVRVLRAPALPALRDRGHRPRGRQRGRGGASHRAHLTRIERMQDVLRKALVGTLGP